MTARTTGGPVVRNATVETKRTRSAVDVDVVPVSSMGPRFAAVAFEEGVVVLGTEGRRDEAV